MPHKLTSPVTLRLHTTATVERECDCDECQGSGSNRNAPQVYSQDARGMVFQPCLSCDGSGTGVVKQAVSVDVDVEEWQWNSLDDYMKYIHKPIGDSGSSDEIINALLDRYEKGEQIEGIKEMTE